MKLSVLSSVVGVCLLAAPVLAMANDFVVQNRTKYTMTFLINGACSSEFGAIVAGTNHAIPQNKFQKACEASPHKCIAVIYDSTNNCVGKIAGTVQLDVDKGVVGGQVNQGYTITYAPMRMALIQTV